jgi:hypothetical protein
VEQVHTFGGEHLCRQILNKLELEGCLRGLGFNAKQTNQVLISIAARALLAASEYKTSQLLEMNSALKDCFSYHDPIDHRQLYAVTDRLYSHKDAIDTFLHQRITTLFGLENRLVILDISNRIVYRLKL